MALYEGKFAEEKPGFIMTSEPGSFAQKTILYRKPKIIDSVIAENNYPSHITSRLIDFKREILNGRIQPLTEDAPDVKEWNALWMKFNGRGWLELPWYFAESYFYRRLLEIVEYFKPGPLEGLDPFRASKERQIAESINVLSAALENVSKVYDLELCFENLLHASLWGNRIDLSNLTVPDDVRRRQAMIERENLLINDFSRVAEVFMEGSLSHVAFINDNVGAELGFDIILADFILRNGWADKATFYLKPYPFFVSDAMLQDFMRALQAFISSPYPNLIRLGKSVLRELVNGTIELSADWFWASPYHFSQMPEALQDEISLSDIVILKGDVNYRRLLEDRRWPYITPITRIVDYFPTSILILRTLKGEIIVGLREGQAEKMQMLDPEWLINGKRGIIQYVEKRRSVL
ncbi:MAG: damage-control phosphatase ARMT1 family protein [Candidatus Bathyarchaeia archaeon]